MSNHEDNLWQETLILNTLNFDIHGYTLPEKNCLRLKHYGQQGWRLANPLISFTNTFFKAISCDIVTKPGLIVSVYCLSSV